MRGDSWCLLPCLYGVFCGCVPCFGVGVWVSFGCLVGCGGGMFGGRFMFFRIILILDDSFLFSIWAFAC